MRDSLELLLFIAVVCVLLGALALVLPRGLSWGSDDDDDGDDGHHFDDED